MGLGFRVEGLGFRAYDAKAYGNKIRGTLFGVPIIRTIVYWGSILGPPFFGKLAYGESDGN